jgi:hypothetical protein
VHGGAVPPYRMPTPAAGDLIRWPDTFGRRFIVFVDVEEEFDWSAPLQARNSAVTAIPALAEAHARFADHGTGLACMVDYPVASDPAAADILRGIIADGRSSIGAQLHAWVTPPYANPRLGDSYAGNLPPSLEGAKLDTLTTLLQQTFGTHPLAYRAGRYGVGPATVDLLAERGYRIETSVRARYDYSADLGPDFSRVGNAAYHLGQLIELPLTTVFTGRLRRQGASLYPASGAIPRGRGILARSGLLQRIALTPEDMPISDALVAVRTVVEQDDERLLSFSFHSPSLVPGHTPYVQSQADLARFWEWWNRMFALLNDLEVTCISLAEVSAAFDRQVQS